MSAQMRPGNTGLEGFLASEILYSDARGSLSGDFGPTRFHSFIERPVERTNVKIQNLKGQVSSVISVAME